jgi:hypothetical protein
MIQQDGRFVIDCSWTIEKRKKKSMVDDLIDEGVVGGGGGGLYICDECQERWMGRHGNRLSVQCFSTLPDLPAPFSRNDGGFCRSGFSFVFKDSRHTVYRPHVF